MLVQLFAYLRILKTGLRRKMLCSVVLGAAGTLYKMK